MYIQCKIQYCVKKVLSFVRCKDAVIDDDKMPSLLAILL